MPLDWRLGTARVSSRSLHRVDTVRSGAGVSAVRPPALLVVGDLPELVAAEAGHGHVPELYVRPRQAEAHVVQVEGVQRGQPSLGYPGLHVAL